MFEMLERGVLIHNIFFSQTWLLKVQKNKNNSKIKCINFNLINS
ncbi:MAG: Unknown protein [uncultured Aureispira sp.]|uniref:Uncharacterized protein n=1 Tax=uncultured Aureispira sp. TaxID=1331704 RepID=A0A6S6SZ64_9BACT|nr:MAG: Unknown protein [uncultured Aureispira sp.]